MALRLLLKESYSQLARSGSLLRASAAAAPAARPFSASQSSVIVRGENSYFSSFSAVDYYIHQIE
jgi:hypothetical protein